MTDSTHCGSIYTSDEQIAEAAEGTGWVCLKADHAEQYTAADAARYGWRCPWDGYGIINATTFAEEQS